VAVSVVVGRALRPPAGPAGVRLAIRSPIW